MIPPRPPLPPRTAGAKKVCATACSLPPLCHLTLPSSLSHENFILNLSHTATCRWGLKSKYREKKTSGCVIFTVVCLGKSFLGSIAHVCSPYKGERCSKGREGSRVGVFGRKWSTGEKGCQNLMFTLGSPNSFLSQTSPCASSDPDKRGQNQP